MLESLNPPDLSPETLTWLAEHRLLQEAIQANILQKLTDSIALSDEDKQACFQYFVEQNGFESPEDVEAYCKLNRLTPDSLERIFLLPARMQKLWLDQFSPKAEAHFLKRKDKLDQVVYSLIRLKDAGLARELYLKILEEESDFAELAQRYSEGPEQQTRGIVGPVPLTQGHPNLVERLRSSAPGHVIEPFQVEDWWLVVRVESVTPATFNEDIRLAMSRELFDDWLQNEIRRQLQLLSARLDA